MEEGVAFLFFNFFFLCIYYVLHRYVCTHQKTKRTSSDTEFPRAPLLRCAVYNTAQQSFGVMRGEEFQHRPLFFFFALLQWVLCRCWLLRQRIVGKKNGLAVRLHQSGNALFLHMQVTHIHNTRGAVGLLPAATTGFPVLRLSLSLPVEYLDVD